MLGRRRPVPSLSVPRSALRVSCDRLDCSTFQRHVQAQLCVIHTISSSALAELPNPCPLVPPAQERSAGVLSGAHRPARLSSRPVVTAPRTPAVTLAAAVHPPTLHQSGAMQDLKERAAQLQDKLADQHAEFSQSGTQQASGQSVCRNGQRSAGGAPAGGQLAVTAERRQAAGV